MDSKIVSISALATKTFGLGENGGLYWWDRYEARWKLDHDCPLGVVGTEKPCPVCGKVWKEMEE
jgi:hypothetical protein